MAQDQLELFHIPNPCVGVCESNRLGYCKGCLRSREERFDWHGKSEQEQRRIIELLSKRKSRIIAQLKQQKAIHQDVTELTQIDIAQHELFDQFAGEDNK